MVTRRDLLKGGVAAGLLGIGSGPAIARLAKNDINPRLVSRALKAFEQKRHYLKHTDLIGIADFSQASAKRRFYLLNPRTSEVINFQVAHGRGSDPQHRGYLDRFSNEHGSLASSAGAYVTTEYYHGKYGRSLRLRGLDRSNSNAEARNIVIHAAPYAEPEVADHYGKLGRSEGCFAFSKDSHRRVMGMLGPGRLLYCDKV